MTKAELMTYVGEKAHIAFKNGSSVYGTLGYVDEFSEKHDFRKPNYFYIGNVTFKVSHVKKVIESEE